MNLAVSVTRFVYVQQQSIHKITRTSLKSFLSNKYSLISRNGSFKFTLYSHNTRHLKQLTLFQAFSTFPHATRVHSLVQRPRVLCSNHSRCSSQDAKKLNRKKRKTFYDMLDVHPSATQSEIKSAYYELSMKYHPDVNTSAEARDNFTDITKAYSVLSKLETRREYDKEIGTYYMTRSYQKRESGKKVLRLMDDVVEIDMKNIKQSTTFLCNVVSLSSILGAPVRLNNIECNKTPHGIQSRDLRMLQLLRQVCNGTLVANKGSTTVTFFPSDLQSGMFSSETGRFGSISLLMESALPCLAFGPHPQYSKTNILSIKGTTHSNYGLHIDYMDKVENQMLLGVENDKSFLLALVYRPLIKKFGYDFTVEIRKKSYVPNWDGRVVFRSLPSPQLRSVSLTDCGTLTKISGWSFVAGSKPIRVAQLMSKNLFSQLKKRFPSSLIRIDSTKDRDTRSEGNGQGVLILGETSTGLVLSGTALWQKGMRSEEVVDRALNMFLSNIESGSCVDEQLQDKVILLMAVASGRSVLRCSTVTARTRTAIKAIETLSEVRFTITKDTDSQTSLLSCDGLGLINEYVSDDDNEL